MLKEITEFLNQNVSNSSASLVEAEVGSTPIVISSASLKAVCFALRDSSNYQFSVLQVVSAVDYEDRIEVNYMLCSFEKNLELILKVSLAKSGDELPKIDSVCDVWKAANFLEREVYDLMGVDFTGHPDLRRILCPDDWEGHPLRKDYKVQESWQGFEINPAHKINQNDFDFMTKLKIEQANPKLVSGSWGGHVTSEFSEALKRKTDALSSDKTE